MRDLYGAQPAGATARRPAAADPYVLATTRNSLLSAVFDVQVRAGASWGALLHAAGIAPADLDRVVREQVAATGAR